jgi:hypothetical protein
MLKDENEKNKRKNRKGNAKKNEVTSFTVHMNIERGELAPQLF